MNQLSLFEQTSTSTKPKASKTKELNEDLISFSQLDLEHAIASGFIEADDLGEGVDPTKLNQLPDWFFLQSSHWKIKDEIFQTKVFRWMKSRNKWMLHQTIVWGDDCPCPKGSGSGDCMHKRAIAYWKQKQKTKKDRENDQKESQKREISRSEINQEREDLLEWMRQGSRFNIAAKIGNDLYGRTKPFFDLSLDQLLIIKEKM